MDFETGYFGDNKYPYVKFGHGSKNLVIFPPSRDLIRTLALDPEREIRAYQKMLPKQFSGTVFILGYDIEVSEKTFCREIAADFAIFIKDHVGKAIIVGISYGGAVAIPFAQQNPELTEKLVLLVSAYGLSDPGVKLCENLISTVQKDGLYAGQMQIDGLIHGPIRILMKLTHWIQWKWKKLPTNLPKTFINAYTHISRHPLGLKPHLSGIKAPTIIIGGENDQFFSPERYQETADLIPNAQLVLIKNGSHPIPMEKPRYIKKLVFDFIMKAD
ncbi:MAG: alpha/beta fold hydrolase [Promethearchaeota archaeon]